VYELNRVAFGSFGCSYDLVFQIDVAVIEEMEYAVAGSDRAFLMAVS
jgi:hypothetical protein